ncbi:hypothetical protein [Defluviitalea phaphyphila]|uniref:hypothetical protein n=1 Tax=Defluviitalea phaphyphila TaxID=1473580 RepID=UPI000730E24B|nr:hypothetical protein [Defluviitalea phaphyphila]
MKVVERPCEKLYKFFLFVLGIPLFIIGIILLIKLKNWALILNGILWIALGIGLKIKNIYYKYKLKMLKNEGICYEASVVKLVPSHWMHIGSYVISRVECAYKTEKGNCIVKSGYYLLSPFDRIEDLYAKVYFDNENSEKYIIELFRKDTSVIS